MRQVSLDPTPVTTSQLGFGCAALMRLPLRRQRQDLLAASFDAGIRHFDVARMYGLGAAEAELGRFAHGRRDQISIATKFGIEARPASWMGRLQGPARALIGRYPALRRLAKRREASLHVPRSYDVATARASLEASLRQLGTDYIDLLFIHDPLDPAEVPIEELHEFLEETRQRGTIRAWGAAGEPNVLNGLGGRLPAAAVSQVRDGILDRPPAGIGKYPRIAFGLLDPALGHILAHVRQSPEALARWSNALGTDAGDPAALAPLLLGEGADANPGAVTLFATSRPGRIEEAVAAVAEPDPQGAAALRSLVRAELRSGSA